MVHRRPLAGTSPSLFAGVFDVTYNSPAAGGLAARDMILIVDDHDDTRRVMALLLRRLGFSADTAPDGPAALSRMRAHRPDVVLLDYNMPGMNGLEVLETIRSSDELRDVPVVLFTAAEAESVLDGARQLGIQGYLRKGRLDADMLVGCIRPFVHAPPAA